MFWVLTLTALFGFMALAINLGNLLQSTDNVQNAADSAALSGASSFVAGLKSGSPFYTTVSPAGFDCRVSGSQIERCNGGSGPDPYGWLIPQGGGSAYIYENIGQQNAGWWQIVPASQAGDLLPGQTTDMNAFEYGTQSGSWSCIQETRRNPKRCLEVTTGVTGTQNGALSNGLPVTATGAAMAMLQQSYAINPNWSGCPVNPPVGFSVAEGWAGVTCVAYCIPSSVTSCGGTGSTTFWVMALVQAPPSFIESDGVTCTGKAAWANAAGLLTAAPVPSGNCG